jgi:DHA2 family multidrug resistance protein-like MFS transporter
MLVQDGLPARERTRALLVIILGIVMAVLDGTIVNLALPDITRELNATPAQSIWVINAYQVATLALLLPLATLGDIVGYRRVYLVGLSVFTLASLLCALADSLTTLALARVLQGLGAAGLMSVNTALVRLIYPKHLLGRGIAINSLVVATASVAGPSIAAAILSVASWPWLFALNVPFGLLSVWLGRKALPENLPRQRAGCRRSTWCSTR